MYFMLIYELNNREFMNMELLKRELMRRGHEVEIFNKTENIKLRHKRGVMLIPNSYNKKNLDNYRYIFNSRGNTVAIYPCEQLINRKLPNFYDNSKNNPVKYLYTLCWGQDYYDFICSQGNVKDRCFITGAIQLDLCRNEFESIYVSKNKLSMQYCIDKKKKWILFISDFVYVSRKVTNHFIKSRVADSEVLINEYIFEKKSQKNILKWFELFLLNHKDFVVIYRKHPNEIISESVNELREKLSRQFFIIDNYSIRNWILVCEKILNYNSTAGAECLAADKECAILRPFEFPINIKLHEQEINMDMLRINNYDDFCNFIIYHNGRTKKSTINKYYRIEERPSFMRVADILEYIAEQNEYKCENNFFYKRWLYIIKNNIIFKVAIKKIYKILYTTFNVKSSNSKRIGEWQRTANNYKNENIIAKQLDYIINRYFI